MADTWGESDKPVKTASNQGEAWGEGDSAVPASALRKVGDLGLSVAKGVVAVPEALVGLADIPTGGRVGKFLENEGGVFGFRPKQAKEYLGGLQSDDLRDKQQQFQKADGIIDKAGVAISNPSLITNAVAESVPLMGAGVAPARAALAVAPKLGAVAAGAMGEGVVGAGSAAEGIRQETADGLLTPAQSGLALASGAATSAFGFAGGKMAQRLGIGDVDTLLTQGAIKTAGAPSAKSIPRQVVEGAIAEGWLEELPQSVSEQVLQNLALDKPWHEGVSDAAVMGALAGMAMGGGAAGVSGFAQDAPPADAQQPPAAPPAPPRPQAGPALALPAPDPGVIAVGGDGTARTPAYQKPSFAGDYADVTDVVPRALAPQPADPVRAAVESAANSGGAISPAALVAIDSGVTPRQESAFEDVPELGAQPPQVNLDDIADPYDRAYYESLFDDDPAPLGAPPVLSAFLQNDDDIPDFDAANNVSEEDFLRALGADEQEIQDAIATTPDRAESAPEGAALPAGPQANVTAGTPEGAGAGAAQPAGPVTDAPTNLRDALAKVRAQKQEAANAQAAQAPAPAAAPAPGPTGAAAVEAAGVAPQASIQAITAKQIPDMTDAELQAAIVHYGPAHKRTAKLQKEAQRRAALPPQSQPNGAPNVPQADQAQQAAAQPAQAGPAQPAQGLTDAAAAQNHGAQGTPAPGAQAQASDAGQDDKAKWIKAAVDKSRLNGSSGVQLTVTPQGEVTFSGDPRSTKEGKALLATYEEALRAGATKKEIADALMAARGQAAARPDVTLTNEGDTTPAAAEDSNANQAQTTSQQAQVATESGAPEETREQRAQRVAEAGESWTRMPTVEREALAARAAGLNPIQRKNVPKSTWANLNASIQRRLADAMGGRAETGGNQAAAATADVQEPPSRTPESASTAGPDERRGILAKLRDTVAALGEKARKAAAERENRQAGREIERELFRELTAANAGMAGKTQEEVHAAVKARLAARDATTVLNVVAAGRLARAIHKHLQVNATKQPPDAGRDPLAKQEAILEGLGAAYGEEGPEPLQQANFLLGMEHALAGKTKSTLSGDGLADMAKGYEHARAWIKTPAGAKWFEGKGRKKLENTGTDLRRHWEAMKEQMKAGESDMDKAWAQIEAATNRADLFSPYLPEGAKPGWIKYVTDLRGEVQPFKKWLQGTYASWYGWGSGAGNGDNLKYMREGSRYPGGLAPSDRQKWETDPAYRLAWLQEAASTYIEKVKSLTAFLDGSASVAQASTRMVDTFIKDEYRAKAMKPGEYMGSGYVFNDLGNDLMGKYSKISDAPGVLNGGQADMLKYRFGSDWTQTLIEREDTLALPTKATPLTPPKLDRVTREGGKDWRKGKDVTPAQFKAAFGFADVGFGNWVGARNDQDHLNYAYDAFMDMAEHMGIEPKYVGLSGTLHFTIGALGHGKHAAHFHPAHPGPTGMVQVINLTNTKGDGTVYHEWGHALDHNLGGDWSQVRAKIINALTNKVFSRADWERKAAGFLTGGAYWRGDKRMAKVDAAVQAIDYYKVSGRRPATAYKTNADQLGKDYWGNEKELFARAIEAWAVDTLGHTNAYLAQPAWAGDGAVTQAKGYRGTPYPTGTERTLFNELLTALAKSITVVDGKLTVSNAAFEKNLPALMLESRAAAAELGTKEGMRAFQRQLMERRENENAEAQAKRDEAARVEREEQDRLAAEAMATLQAPTVDEAPASQTAGPLTDDDLTAIFDEAAAELREGTQEEPDAPAPGEALATEPESAPVASPREPRAAPASAESAADKSAAALVAEAAKLGVKGVGEAMAGLAKLFGGGPGRLNSFPSGFDEETYAKAKPHFKAALTAFQDAGKTLKDLFKLLIQQFGDGVKPYAVQFAKDEGLGAQLSKAPQQGDSMSPSAKVAGFVHDQLAKNEAFTWQALFAQADAAFAGTQAEGKYTPKDAYDAMEAGMNSYILANPGAFNPNASNEAAALIVTRLHNLTQLLPTQSKRTAEQDEFQQFSTVPALAFAANWAAAVSSGDTMLEPSAGIGGLAVFAKNAGARLVLNELSARRAGVLREVFPGAKVYQENAEQINNILSDSDAPSVVVMNPPFSATAGRIQGKRDTKVGALHVEQALKRLTDGGRLVAIVGEGMNLDRPAFKDWWDKIRQEYDVRAVIPMDGSGYAKYGTTFDNAILVIDKAKPSGRAIVTTPAKSYTELINLLAEIRNDRPQSSIPSSTADEIELHAAEQALGEPAAAGEGVPENGQPDGIPGAGVGDGDAGGRSGLGPRRGGGGGGGGSRSPRRDGGKSGGRSGRAGDNAAGGGVDDASLDGGPDTTKPSGLRITAADESAPQELTESVFESYRPQRLQVSGAKDHPGPLVQSAAMAAVLPPAPTYTPNLPANTVSDGLLSIAQIEAVVYAGQAHSETLPPQVRKAGEQPVTFRRGFFIGDGTGVGKGREISGILLDNIRQGRKRHVWVSEKQGLMNDAKRDYKGVLGDDTILFNQNQTKAEDAIPDGDGILFTTYSTLRSGAQSQATAGTGKPATKAQLEKAFPVGSPIVNNRNDKVYYVQAFDVKTSRIFASADPDAQNYTGALRFSDVVSIAGYTDFADGDAVRAIAAGKHAKQLAASGKTPKAAGQSRLDQLVNWLGEDFDGVIAFDEAHNAGNAVSMKGERGSSDPSDQALAVVELQERLPNARVVYVSATGATQVSNLSFATRLGLWGQGTPFPSVQNFIAEMNAGGLASMELVARDLKQMGSYMARSLSFEGVTYSRLEHELTPIQRDIYNRLAEAWQVTLQNMDKALEMTGAVGENGKGNSKAKTAAKSAYWGAQQRFFNQIITSMQMPTVLSQIEADVAAGHAVVLQLVNTNEAQQTRAIAERKVEGATDLEDLDLTPRDMLIQMVQNSFPVVQHQEVMDDNGKTKREPVKNADGSPVLNRDAVAMRDKLLEDLRDIRVPDGPLEMVLNQFGPERVAEVTGRTQRVVRKDDGQGNLKAQLENRGSSAARADADSFMADKKPILVFSDAGGTGFSFHADLTKTNQRKRKHYLIQPGWRADKAVQGFGRTHRTNQASAPHYFLASTDIPAQKRFLSAIARRLDQLGALTKGQRDTANQGMFSERDNLESKYATQAVRQFFEDGVRGRLAGISFQDFLRQTGLEDIMDTDTNSLVESKMPSTRLFLNRMLSLTLDMQNKVFDAFLERMDEKVMVAQERGEFDAGLQTIRALESKVVSDDVAYVDEKTGAETRLVELELKHATTIYQFPEKLAGAGYVVNAKSGKVYVRTKRTVRVTTKAGAIVDGYRLQGTTGVQLKDETDFASRDGVDPYRTITEQEARELWAAENAKRPEFFTERMHMVVGAMLPIWDRLKVDGAIKVARTQTVDGRRLLGMLVDKKSLPELRKRLNLSSSASKLTPEQVMVRLLQGDTGELSNGWKLERVRVSNDLRIEITNGYINAPTGRELTGIGVLMERINWKERYFVPTGAAGVPVLARLTANRPVVELSQADAGGADASFSRSMPLPANAPPADSNARNVATLLLVDGLKAKWTRAPEIIVARNMQDGQIPQAVRDYDETLKSQGATGEARGFIYKGKVYLLSDQLKGPEQIAEVLFHEVLGHYGLRGAFGEALTSILQQMGTMRRSDVVAKAREYGLFDSDVLGGLDKDAASDAQIWAAMSPKDRLSAAEEVLAEMAQTQPNIGFVQRAIAAIRNWLRAHVPGFERMRLTDADIVQAYILPARGYVTRSNETAQQAIDRAMLAFSRAYHGTPHRGIEKFSTDKIGTGEGAQAYGWGLYFASRRGIAERYRKALQTVTRGGLLYKGKPLTSAAMNQMARTGSAAEQSVFGARWPAKNIEQEMAKRAAQYEADAAEKAQQGTATSSEWASEYSRRASAIRTVLADMERRAERENGQLYEVEIPEDSEMLLWDKPLAEAPEGVRDAVYGMGLQGRWMNGASGERVFIAPPTATMSGEQAYARISRLLGSDQAASEALAAAGVKGIKYLDGTSRKDGDGSYNYVVFTGDDVQIERAHFSRAAVSGMASKARDELNRTFAAPGKLSWWHKSVGTMYNLAERSPVFKRVFDSAQGFVDDVSHYATDAAELAPKLLPKLETWRDIAKRPISASDNAAVAKPVFEGTLDWARDEAGKPVRLQVLLDAAEKLTPEQKARRLLRNNKISEGMLKAWKGLPLEQYENLVASRYESQMLQAGIVWTPAELKSQFKLNDAQVALYQEFRAATDRSLDTMARSDMLRFGGEDVKDLADMVMDAKDAQDAAQILRDHLLMLAKENPDRAGAIGQLANGMLDRAARVQELQEQGYAPLSRFGKYTVDVVDAGGERQYFGLFETAREANIMALKMRKGFGQDAVTQGTLSDEEFKLLAGITPESLELFGNMLGLDATGDDAQDQAFQEYLRRTKTNRSAMRRLIHRQGIAGYSEDVGRVLASFIYSNARQTSAGLHMGDLGEAITGIPKQQGELKDAAIQLSEYVKNPQEEAQMVRGLLFAQYLGGSIASAVVNMTQPLAVSFPWLSQFGGAKQAATELGRAAKNLASRGHRYEADLAAALKLAEEEGTVSPQEVHQLMAQARGSGSLRPGDGTRAGDARAAAGNALTRLSLGWGKVFGAAEQVNRRMTFIAAYRVAKAQGMANPAAFAKKAVVETQFVYSKANKMKWGRGAVGATVMTFKTYSIAYIELLHRMYTQGGPEGKQAVLLALAVLMLMGGAGGLPFAEDAEDLVDGLAQMMGYNFNSKKAKQELLDSVFGEAGAGFVERGITGLPGMPLDVSGRLGMGNLLPGTGIFKEKTDHTRDVLELVGPVGDLAKRVASGGRAILTGDVGAGLLQVSPVAVRNAAKGADMAARGMYRDDKGYKVLDTTPAEAAMKAIGFQPASVSKVQEANFINQQAKNFYSMQANEIRALWARGIFEQNPDLVEDARARVEDWNRKNPDQRMVIAMPAVFKRVREMSKTKDQRIADTAPKAMRQALREESARARAAQ